MSDDTPVKTIGGQILRQPGGSGGIAPGAVPLRQVQVFNATIGVSSKRQFMLTCPADMTDQDLIDLIKELATNLTSKARDESVVTRLIAPPGTISSSKT